MRTPTFTRLLLGLGSLAALVLAPGCTSEPLSGPMAEPVQAVSVTLPTAMDTLFVGATLQLRATVRCQHGDLLERPVTWRSENEAVAQVSEAGIVTAVAHGTTILYATADKVTGQVHVHVIAPVNAVTIEPAVATLDEGETIQLAAALRDRDGVVLDRPITWATGHGTIATVDQAGLVTALHAGTATIAATAEGKTGTATITVLVPVNAVEVAPATAALSPGGTVQLAATPRDAAGGPLVRAVTWQSSAPGIATIDANGLVTAVQLGTATITATSGGRNGTAAITVRVPVATVAISDPGMEPLAPGATLQLTATAYDAGGAPLTGRTFHWASSNTGLATVDQAGVVTGVAQGTVTITATSEGIGASVDIRIAGEATTLGNNLSLPVVFAEGIGVTGLATSADAGLRPLPAEGIAVGPLPFWHAGNVSDYQLNGVNYFMQQGANTWQAEWATQGPGAIQAEVAWGDNLTSVSFNSHQNIHVELVLYDRSGRTLKGFNMTSLYGTNETEMQGTDGTIADFAPTIFAVTPRLTIQKLNDQTLQPAETVFDGAVHEGFGGDGSGVFAGEVTVSGRLSYGYNLLLQNITLQDPTMHKYGWWRITFSLDGQGMVGGSPVNRNVAMASMAPNSGTLFTPHFDAATQTTWIDINIKQASGGGGGGH